MATIVTNATIEIGFAKFTVQPKYLFRLGVKILLSDLLK